MSRLRRQTLIDGGLATLAAGLLIWGLTSYLTGGIVRTVFETAADGERSLAAVRQTLEAAGMWAPAVYVLAVVVEVMVAPLPGTLLYAPGGAIFGGWWGGTLSLAGNVLGAALATWLALRFRHRLPGALSRPDLQPLVDRVRRRGVLVVALLRVNPLTSSDLVSYAAGLAGIAVWRVALGTLVGMAPLCYAQAHASSWLFSFLPGAGIVLVALGVVYVGVVVWVISRGRS